jgi:hypothetical protein
VNLPDSAVLLVVVLVLIVGTTARLTRLVTADTITDPIRAWTERKVKAKTSRAVWRKFDDLIVCPWCVGMQISIPCSYIGLAHWDNYFVFGGMLALTTSWIVGNVQMREPD